MAAVQILVQLLLDEQRERVEAFPHAGMAPGEPHAHADMNGDHYDSTTSMICFSIAASTPARRSRRPLASSILRRAAPALAGSGDAFLPRLDRRSAAGGSIPTDDNATGRNVGSAGRTSSAPLGA